MKTCIDCGKFKKINEFAWRNKKLGKRLNQCQPCRNLYARAWYSKNRERISLLKWGVKIGTKCAICHSKELLVVDHDHQTGKVRGTLCHRCNTGIGLLRDDPDLLAGAIVYLCSEGDD